MITEEEYKKALEIVFQYEKQEEERGYQEVMFCTTCQAMNEIECYCEAEDDEEEAMYRDIFGEDEDDDF